MLFVTKKLTKIILYTVVYEMFLGKKKKLDKNQTETNIKKIPAKCKYRYTQSLNIAKCKYRTLVKLSETWIRNRLEIKEHCNRVSWSQIYDILTPGSKLSHIILTPSVQLKKRKNSKIICNRFWYVPGFIELFIFSGK